MTATAPRILGRNSPPQNPNSKVVGWHFDFLLTCPTLADGASAIVELPIPPGAPFCLRAIGGYIVSEEHVVTPMTDGFLQFMNPQDQFLQVEAIGTSGDWPSGGFNALYEPVYNQVPYPANSVLTVKLTNQSGGTWYSPRLVFRGAKLYYSDRIYSPTYPECYTSYPYSQPLTLALSANTTIQDIPFQVTGADFALRGGVLQIDSSVSGNMNDLRLKLKDQEGRPYSSDFIHHQWLLSTSLANRPGIFYPEIYLPKDRILLVDAQQFSPAATVQLVFSGERIFPK